MACPICGGTVVAIVYGMPGGDMIDEAERGLVRLGGCVIEPGQPTHACSNCGVELEPTDGGWESAAKRAFLLTWNPTKFAIPDALYNAQVLVTEAGDALRSTWSIGNRTGGIEPGDRAYWLRQHDTRGIIGSGTFLSTPYQDTHWANPAKTAWYADVEWDRIVPLEQRYPVEGLERDVPEVHWGRVQSSGVQVAPAASARLYRLWRDHLDRM